MAKECQLERKEQETRTCFKYNKKGYIAKDCKEKQTMKKRKVQEGSDDENKENEQSFGEDLEQAWYKKSSMKIPRIINILFRIAKLARERRN